MHTMSLVDQCMKYEETEMSWRNEILRDSLLFPDLTCIASILPLIFLVQEVSELCQPGKWYKYPQNTL